MHQLLLKVKYQLRVDGRTNSIILTLSEGKETEDTPMFTEGELPTSTEGGLPTFNEGRETKNAPTFTEGEIPTFTKGRKR